MHRRDPVGISTCVCVCVSATNIRNPSRRGKLELKALSLSRVEHAIIILTKVH